MDATENLQSNLQSVVAVSVPGRPFVKGVDPRRLMDGGGRKPDIMRARKGLELLGINTAPKDMIEEIKADWPSLPVPEHPNMFWLLWARLWIEAAKGSQWAAGFVVSHTTGLPRPIPEETEGIPEGITLELRADEIPLAGLTKPRQEIDGELITSGAGVNDHTEQTTAMHGKDK